MKTIRSISGPFSKPPKQSAGRNDFRLFAVVGSPYLQVRMMVAGKRRQFSTGETSERAAGAKARAILADIRSRGFAEAVSLHSRKDDVVEANPTIENLSLLFEKIVATFESPPTKSTVRVYSNNLKLICGYCGAKNLNRLTTETIDQGKRKYLAHSAAAGRSVEASRTSLASIIRNASAIFSKQALAAFHAHGLNTDNPFIDSRVKGVKIKTYSPLPRKVLENIWEKAPLLRDGDPEAPQPDETLPAKKRVDFRNPHPDAYSLLFLELGLGLRRNEADKAEWSWCSQTRDERRFLEVRESDVFTPKSKRSRTIPIAADVWEALESVRKPGDRFIVTARIKRTRVKSLTSYRCDSSHNTLVVWLRGMGVKSAKPCHALRKEFGSYVATSFSLFHAQKLLGHSSPSVTSDYYAGLTGLPDLNPIGKAT